MDIPKPKPLTVTLVSHTKNPLGTLLFVWLQSRAKGGVVSPGCLEDILHPSQEDIETKCTGSFVMNGEEYGYEFLQRELQMLLSDAVPVTEHVTFSFSLQNIPISVREQLVRHRIGIAIDPRVGADIIAMDILPELASSSFWSQTSRVLNQGTFFDEGRFIVPESLKGKQVFDGPTSNDAESYYLGVMKQIQCSYRKLVEAGVPLEDARQLIPSGSTHNMVWTLTLKSLQNVIGKRSCWISQASIWGELISQLVNELCTKVSPLFSILSAPPCVKHGKFHECVVKGTNEDRIRGNDGDQPPCPWYIQYHNDEAFKVVSEVENPAWNFEENSAKFLALDIRQWTTTSTTSRGLLEANAKRFSKLWHVEAFIDTFQKEEKVSK